MNSTDIFSKSNIRLIEGDCLEVMKEMPSNFIGSYITDPPYALEFMGKGWDKVLPDIEIWRECLRVAKPGAMLMAFGGTRTYHRLTCAIEDAGWVIRDCIMWVYGSGFPKNHDISKAIDRAVGVERLKGNPRTDGRGKWELKVNRDKGDTGVGHADGSKQKYQETLATSPEAQAWEGYGTALKPAYEPLVLAMKPLDGTFAQNALKWGVAGLWIDGGRIETSEHGAKREHKGTIYEGVAEGYKRPNKSSYTHKTDWHMKEQGRWPANLIHDGSEEVVGLFPMTQPSKGNYVRKIGDGQFLGAMDDGLTNDPDGLCGSGSAARFFQCCPPDEITENTASRIKYCAKASRAERGEGNDHPTVKPLALIEYLCKLTRMPNSGIVCDPFMGSGTTGVACKKLGRKFIGIEKGLKSFKIAEKRIRAPVQKMLELR